MESLEPSKKSQSKKAYFYELALEEFQKNGFDQTSMRHLAQVAGVSLGSFYYYYPSKESIIQSFYEESFGQVEKQVEEIKKSHKNFKTAFVALLLYRIETFAAQRELMISLSRTATDPKSSLSPFAEGPDGIKTKTSELIKGLIEHYDFPIESRLRPFMPELLWFYMMGIVLFWVFDKSNKQIKTTNLIEDLTPHIIRLIRASALPIAKPINTPLVKILRNLYS